MVLSKTHYIRTIAVTISMAVFLAFSFSTAAFSHGTHSGHLVAHDAIPIDNAASVGDVVIVQSLWYGSVDIENDNLSLSGSVDNITDDVSQETLKPEPIRSISIGLGTTDRWGMFKRSGFTGQSTGGDGPDHNWIFDS